MLELITDSVLLVLSIAFVYFALHLYARRAGTAWTLALMRRRIAVLLTIALVATGIKVFEDVLGHESGLFDEVILRFIREHTPSEVTDAFATITATGSLRFLTVVAVVTTLVLLLARRWFDAILVAVSPAIAASLVTLIKVAVGRSRPDGGVGVYAGASFPSGHTVGVAAFATAVAIVATGIWPKSRFVAASLAVAWIALVALSRLVLGAHWPTDVLAAACLGAAIPLLISFRVSVSVCTSAVNGADVGHTVTLDVEPYGRARRADVAHDACGGVTPAGRGDATSLQRGSARQVGSSRNLFD